MNHLFELATKISTTWSLAAFAIIVLVLVVTKLKGRRFPAVAWWVVAAIVIIALAPMVAPAYLNSYGIYRVRVVVLDERKVPTNDAKVTCSVGGEVKKVEGGWECDIPSKTKPIDGKMQAYARINDAFLTGRTELELQDDYSPVATIQLTQDTSALVLGIVMDESNQPVEGARVGVIGYDSEAGITKAGGGFSLPAHKASGQQVQIFAFKEGYEARPPEWHQAGDHPVTIVLRETSSKRKHK
jgi:energy-coupling factor transporter transmembrane protein EcfT